MATLDQAGKVLALIASHSLTVEQLQWLIESGLLSDLIQAAKFPPLALRIDRSAVQRVLGLTSDSATIFASPREQLRLMERWNVQHSLGFSEEDFAIVRTLPPGDPLEPLVAWTLEAVLRDPVQTFNVLINDIVRTRLGQTLRWHGTCKGLQEGTSWRSMSLRWVRIDFGANLGLVPKDVISERSAHAGILWMAAYSPQWLSMLGTITEGGVYIPEPTLGGFLIHYVDPKATPHLTPTKVNQQRSDIVYEGGKPARSIPEYVI